MKPVTNLCDTVVIQTQQSTGGSHATHSEGTVIDTDILYISTIRRHHCSIDVKENERWLHSSNHVEQHCGCRTEEN